MPASPPTVSVPAQDPPGPKVSDPCVPGGSCLSACPFGRGAAWRCSSISLARLVR